MGNLGNYNQKLLVFCKLSRNQPTGLCFNDFVMIRTCM